MKGKITLIVLCVQSLLSWGQTLVPEPNDTLWIEGVPQNVLTMYDIYQENISDETIELTWETVLVDVPSGWDYSVCDNGTCYVGIPDGFTMPNPVPAGESGFLGLNLTPNSEGSGILQIYVHVSGEPENGFLCTWIFSAATVGVEALHQAAFSLYPNPANEFLTVSNPARQNVQYEIRNAVGDLLVMQTTNALSQEFNVHELTSGVYYLRIVHDRQIQSLRFIKI